MQPLLRIARATFTGWLWFLAVGWMVGCGAVATRQPIYDPAKDGIFDKCLIGTWGWTGGWGFPEGAIQFGRGPANSYFIRGVAPDAGASEDDSGKSAPVQMDLVRLGKYRYLFVRSTGPEIGTILFPAYRVEWMYHEKELRLRLLNTFAIGRFLQTHRDVLRFEQVNPLESLLHPTTRPSETRPAETRPTINNLILTDSPARIRRFLIRHQDDPHWVFPAWVLYRFDPAVSY